MPGIKVGVTVSGMRELNLKNIAMMALVAIALIQNGAQLFAFDVFALQACVTRLKTRAVMHGVRYALNGNHIDAVDRARLDT